MSKTILVTGASKGLGLECARTLLSTFHCNVVSLSRSLPAGLLELKNQYSDHLEIVQGDVTKEEDQQKAVDISIARWNRLDALILNAGILDPLSRIADVNLAEFKNLFDVNFFSLVSMLKIAIPHLRSSQGRAVFTSSGAAIANYTAWGAYTTSKAALNALCRTLAVEEENITFVAVRPGVMDTDMQNHLLDNGKAHMSTSDYKRFVDIHEKGERVHPSKPGFIIAALAASQRSMKNLSGQFINWTDGERLGLYHEQR